jgi:competence protein ComFB
VESILEQDIPVDPVEESIFSYFQKMILDLKAKIVPAKKELIPEGYVPPFNVCEILVETELNLVLSRYLDICRCSQCRVDMIALALRELPPRYISGTRDEDAVSTIAREYMEKTMIAVFKAVKKVFNNPRSSCKKVVTVLWKTRDNLDWIN